MIVCCERVQVIVRGIVGDGVKGKMGVCEGIGRLCVAKHKPSPEQQDNTEHKPNPEKPQPHKASLPAMKPPA